MNASECNYMLQNKLINAVGIEKNVAENHFYHSCPMLFCYVHISHVHSGYTEKALLCTQDMSCMLYMIFPSISMSMEHAGKSFPAVYLTWSFANMKEITVD